nr:DUF1698 domain-containing protein [Candidatus Pantoea edessiphila]
MFPEKRYAQMHNIYFILITDLLKELLEKINFINVKIVNCTTTTCEEQRTTSRMTIRSLNSFLNPNNFSQTIE